MAKNFSAKKPKLLNKCKKLNILVICTTTQCVRISVQFKDSKVF